MSEVRAPWDHLPPPVVRARRDKPVPDPDAPKKDRGRKRKSASKYRSGANDEWLFHHLIVVGPAEDIALFQEAARGVSVEYCRAQARQFVERVQAREARAAERAVAGRGCPFDLQVLLPIPSDILELGMRHPTAIAWLAKHWGTEDRLLQVATSVKARPGRRIARESRFLGYSFFTVDHAPKAAVAAIARSRPSLSFTLRSRPMSWERGWLT